MEIKNNKMILEGMYALQENELEMLYEAKVLVSWDNLDKNKIDIKLKELDKEFNNLKPIKNFKDLDAVQQAKLALRFKIKSLGTIAINTLKGAGFSAGFSAGIQYTHAIAYNGGTGAADAHSINKMIPGKNKKEDVKNVIKGAKDGAIAGAKRSNDIYMGKAKDLTGNRQATEMRRLDLAQNTILGTLLGLLYGMLKSVDNNTNRKVITYKNHLLILNDNINKMSISVVYINPKEVFKNTKSNKLVIKTIKANKSDVITNESMILESSILLKEDNLSALNESISIIRWNDIDKNKLDYKLNQLDEKITSKNSNLKPIKTVKDLSLKEKIHISKILNLKKIGGTTLASLLSGVTTGVLVNKSFNSAIESNKTKLKGDLDKLEKIDKDSSIDFKKEVTKSNLKNLENISKNQLVGIGTSAATFAGAYAGSKVASKLSYTEVTYKGRLMWFNINKTKFILKLLYRNTKTNKIEMKTIKIIFSELEKDQNIK